jgi:hypothetical protein
MNNYKSAQNESIFDVALKNSGMDSIGLLLASNPGLIQPDGSISQGRVTHKVDRSEPVGGLEAFQSGTFQAAQSAQVLQNVVNDNVPQTDGKVVVNVSGQNQSFFDFATGHYGSANYVGHLLENNPSVIQSDGTIQQFRSVYRVDNAIGKSDEIERVNEQTTEVQKIQGDPLYLSTTRQTVFDVCLTQYGGIEALPFLLADNAGSVKSDGSFKQFRELYNIRKLSFVNLGLKSKMLALKPESVETPKGGAWITEDWQDWWTEDNQSWQTEQ